MGTVMAMVFATQIFENANVIHCGLGTTVERRIVWERHHALVMGIAMHISFLDGATVIETGPGRRVTYPVFMVLITAILPVVYVNRVTLELGVINCVPDTAVVSVVGVSVMYVLDIRENSAKFQDVLDGQRIVAVMVHVTWERDNVHVIPDGLGRGAASLIALGPRTVLDMGTVYLPKVKVMKTICFVCDVFFSVQ